MQATVLVESKIALEEQLTNLGNSDAIAKLESGADQQLEFPKIEDTPYWSTQMVAEFYQVNATTITQLAKRHRDELKQDGLKTTEKGEIQKARDALSLPSYSSQATLWTPRAVLRAGMLLRDSEVAKQVRTALLNKVEEKPKNSLKA